MSLNPHEWVSAHADYLYAFALGRINSREQAKDLVQETFLAALERAGNFEGKSSERTWLTAILKNKIVDIYRKNSRGLNQGRLAEAEEASKDFFEEDGHWIGQHAPQEFGIENQDPLINKEFDLILQKCMEKLPALWKAVFTMKHIDEEPADAVCTGLNISPSNFWVIIHRTKLNLRACLQKNWV